MIENNDKSSPEDGVVADQDAQLSRQITDALDQQTGRIDDESRARLNQGREAALAAYTRRRWFALPGIRLAPVLAVAATVVLALGLGWLGGPFVVDAGPPQGLSASLADFELLSGLEEPELFAELEFYAWVGDSFAELDASGPAAIDGAELPPGRPGSDPALAG